MSEEVRTWSWRHAVAKSGLSATTKAVLNGGLSLFMNEAGQSCFPKIADLVEYTGLDKKTVIKHLKIAEDEGWIVASNHGLRGQKWKQKEYRARWPERDIETEPVSAEAGGAAPPAFAGEKQVDDVPEAGGTDVQKLVEEVHQDKEIPDTPPITPPSEREARARDQSPEGDNPETAAPDDDGKPEAADTPGRAAFEKRVMRFCTGRGFAAGPWPDWDGSSPGYVAQQFAKLAPDERAAAEKWRDAYLLDLKDRGVKPIPVGNFMRDRLWTGLDPAVLERAEKRLAAQLPAAERAKPEGWAACLGPVGMAWLFAALLAGPADEAAAREIADAGFIFAPKLRIAWPAVADFQARVRQTGGAQYAPRWHALKDAMEPVPARTGTLAAWREVFDKLGWPWLVMFDSRDVVFCPKGGPEGLEAFEAALAAQNEESEAAE